MNNSRRGQISHYQLFFIVFVSRIVVTFTYVQAVAIGKLSTDYLISLAVSYAATVLLCLPIVFCLKKRKNPFDKKMLSWLYALYFVWFAGVNISRFSYFASSKLSPNASMIAFISIITLCICYASSLGIEPLGRFASFCGALITITMAIALVFNVKNFDYLNLFPIYQNDTGSMIKNTIVLTSNSVEPAVVLSLANRVDGKCSSSLIYGLSLSYFCVFMLLFFAVAVMGNAAVLQTFPIYTLFQTASIGALSRLDSLHIAIWVLALLLKTAVLVNCASLFTVKIKHIKKCVAFSVTAGIVSVLITVVFGTGMVQITKIISTILFAVFVVVIPLLTLIFDKNGEKNLENN